MRNQTIILLLMLVITVASAFGFGYYEGHRSPKIETIEKIETITLTDTITLEKPVFVAVRVIDTMYVAVKETIYINDTTYVKLPVEQKTYEEPELYKAWVSGYNPSLDSLKIYQQTHTVIVTPKPELKQPTLSVGLQAGVGITPKGVQPYVGIGAQICIKSW